MSVRELFSAGECPVCASSGLIAVLKNRTTGAPVFYCPMCGTAWRRIPAPHTLDEALDLAEVAPEGVTLPSRDETSRFVAGPFTEISFDEWQDDLEPLVR